MEVSKYLFTLSVAISFLFFSVQLAVGKIITPIFGGTAWVWVLTLLFFQASLLFGYFVASLLKKQNPRNCLLFLGSIMIISSILVPQPDKWGVYLSSYGLSDVIIVLIYSMALPSVALSSATIILQRTAYSLDITPWQLYFFSNIGSVSAVILYPFVIESTLTLTAFMNIWKTAIVVFGFFVVFLAVKISNFKNTNGYEEKTNDRLEGFVVFKWILYSAVPSAFLAITSVVLTQDIAPVPFLWALPLATFLIAFALPFAPRPVLSDWKIMIICVLLVSLVTLALVRFLTIGTVELTVIHILLLFTVTWICVTELILNKPSANILHYFYIFIAIGGFLGSAIVSILSPLVFSDYSERIIMILIIYWLPLFINVNNDNKKIKYITNSAVALTFFATSFLVYSHLSAGNVASDSAYNKISIHNSRSMYGVIEVHDRIDSSGSGERILLQGNTVHGSQLISNYNLDNNTPTSYYGYHSPLSFLFDRVLLNSEYANVAIIGLGAGVMNYYNRDGVDITYFEIDSNMVDVALEYFSFLDISKGSYDVEIGDGRKLIATKPDSIYSIIIMDAFSSNSIPTHLLTKEAINIYFEKLEEDGILLLHTSNRYLDVHVIADVVLRNNGYYSYIYTPDATDKGTPSTWVIGSKQEIEELKNQPQVEVEKDTTLFGKAWTDNFTSLLPFLKRN